MQHILSGRLMSTRRGTIMVGVAAAGLAALLLVVYLNSYRNSVRAGATPVSVLVAKNLIPKGTSGSVIAVKELFQVSTVTESQLKEGAIADPAAINGRVALADIYPGQQLTVADFSATVTEALPTKITGDQRAIAVPLDGAAGLSGHVAAGDRVDVYVGLTVSSGAASRGLVKLLLPNVLVLAVPGTDQQGPGAAATGNVILRVKQNEAARIAFAADNGKLWLVLRPQSGATPTKPDTATIERLLLGTSQLNAGGN